MSAATHQTGAYVLKACMICGQTFPVRNNLSSIRQTLYCPDCKSSRHAEIERESKHRRVMQRRNAEKARRLREFLAARDAAFERAGLPIPKISVCAGGRIIERRGNCAGTGISYKFGMPTLQPSERKTK